MTWIPVSERLPDPTEEFLVTNGESVQVGLFLYFLAGWATHWMPLPGPPEDDADDTPAPPLPPGVQFIRVRACPECATGTFTFRENQDGSLYAVCPKCGINLTEEP